MKTIQYQSSSTLFIKKTEIKKIGNITWTGFDDIQISVDIEGPELMIYPTCTFWEIENDDQTAMITFEEAIPLTEIFKAPVDIISFFDALGKTSFDELVTVLVLNAIAQNIKIELEAYDNGPENEIECVIKIGKYVATKRILAKELKNLLTF